MLGSRRSLRADALRIISRISPLPKVFGAENIPESGGFLIVVNHYARRGYSTAWNALSLSAALKQEITFIMSEEWAFEGNPFAFILRPLMRAVLASINKVYGFLSMPSMVEGFNTAASRGDAVRRVLRFARSHPQAVIGLAPEGRDSPEDGVGLAPEGGGKFMLHLNRMGFQLLPVVVIEHEGRLVIQFGERFDFLSMDEHSPQVDQEVREMVRGRLQSLFDRAVN